MVATLAVDQEKLARIKRSVGEDYVPSDDEEYMDERQLDYFRMLLLEWKKSIHDAAERTPQNLQDGPPREPAPNVRAPSHTASGLELRTLAPPRHRTSCSVAPLPPTSARTSLSRPRTASTTRSRL